MKLDPVPQQYPANPHCELNEMAFVNSGPAALAEDELPDCLTLWRCIGCGAMGSVEQCTGSCAYQKLDVVGAEDHADFLEHFATIVDQARRLEPVVRQIAALGEEHPDHERAYRSLQKSARTLVRSLDHRAISARNAMVREDERATVWWCATCGQVEAPNCAWAYASGAMAILFGRKITTNWLPESNSRKPAPAKWLRSFISWPG